jgi:hypothetical protein
MDRCADPLHSLSQFDDINLDKSSFPTLNTTYHNLDFTSYRVFDTTSPPRSPPVLDFDCAISGTNALVASRQPGQPWPRFVLDPRVARERGIAPFFNFHGLAAKPVGYVKVGTRIWVNAYGIIDHDKDGDVFTADFTPQSPQHKLPIQHDPAGRYEIISSHSIVMFNQRDGYWENFYLNISELFPGWGEMVNMVEIYAESPTGEDEDGLYTGFEDWMFCTDDIVVEWIESDELEAVTSRHPVESRFTEVQVVLGSGSVVQAS